MDTQLSACIECYRAALATGDTTAIDLLLDEQFIVTFPTAKVADKRQYLSALVSSPAKVLAIDQEEIRSIRHGEVAVVSSAMVTKIQLSGGEHIMRTRCTQVWKLKDEKWRCIAIHHCEFN